MVKETPAMEAAFLMSKNMLAMTLKNLMIFSLIKQFILSTLFSKEIMVVYCFDSAFQYDLNYSQTNIKPYISYLERNLSEKSSSCVISMFAKGKPCILVSMS